MPVYVYRCADCADQTEVMQRMSDDALTVCSACGGHIARVLFAPAIHFKGTGFHNTDYASKKRPGAGENGGGDGSAAKSDGGDGGTATTSENGASTSSGGDSAPATKTESAPATKTVGLDKT